MEKNYLEAWYREMAEDLRSNPGLRADDEIWDVLSGEGLNEEIWYNTP